MRALVTGAAGFVGRHMMTGLASHGWDVIGVDLLGSPYTTGMLIKIDVREVFAGRLMLGERFDLIVHCAYHVGGRQAIDHKPRLLAMNLELDAQLFDWAVHTHQPRVLYYSSSAAYPIKYQSLTPAREFRRHIFDCSSLQKWVPLSERMINLDCVEQPDARYGWAKLTGEHLAAAASLMGLRVHVLRPFSGYGGDQALTYPFPAILRRAAVGDLSVWGPPGQIRDWIHIDDVVDCSLAVVEQDITGPVNVCSGVGVEMGDLAIRMATIAGAAVNWPDPANRDPRCLVESGELRYLEDRPTGVMVRVGDPERMRTIYQPKIDLDEGIRRALGENT